LRSRRCARSCPAGAMTAGEGAPVIDPGHGLSRIHLQKRDEVPPIRMNSREQSRPESPQV
jgi:hypothetical protein